MVERGAPPWLLGRVDFVEADQGFLLLGNSYLRQTSAPPLILYINGQQIKLGGKDGITHYPLKKGDVLVIEFPIPNQEKSRRTTLKLDESGTLRSVREGWPGALEKVKMVSKGSTVNGASLITEPYYLEVLPLRLPPAKPG